MRKILATAIVAVALLASNSRAWEYYLATGGSSYLGDLTSGNDPSESSVAMNAPSNTAPAPTTDSYINTGDPTNSWVQFEYNVVTTGWSISRDLIVFRNPLSAQVAPELAAFQSALNAGKKLMEIQNANRAGYSITTGWQGFSSQTSYDILPGDKVVFFFR